MLKLKSVKDLTSICLRAGEINYHCFLLRAVATIVKYVAKCQQGKLRVVECPLHCSNVKNRYIDTVTV